MLHADRKFNKFQSKLPGDIEGPFSVSIHHTIFMIFLIFLVLHNVQEMYAQIYFQILCWFWFCINLWDIHYCTYSYIMTHYWTFQNFMFSNINLFLFLCLCYQITLQKLININIMKFAQTYITLDKECVNVLKLRLEISDITNNTVLTVSWLSFHSWFFPIRLAATSIFVSLSPPQGQKSPEVTNSTFLDQL